MSGLRFVRETLGQCGSLKLGVYSTAVMSAISREWSLDVSNMRLAKWIVAGDEVKARRYMRADGYGRLMVMGLYRESTLMITVDWEIHASMLLWVFWVLRSKINILGQSFNVRIEAARLATGEKC